MYEAAYPDAAPVRSIEGRDRKHVAIRSSSNVRGSLDSPFVGLYNYDQLTIIFLLLRPDLTLEIFP